jgi:hypothetical protein
MKTVLQKRLQNLLKVDRTKRKMVVKNLLILLQKVLPSKTVEQGAIVLHLHLEKTHLIHQSASQGAHLEVQHRMEEAVSI